MIISRVLRQIRVLSFTNLALVVRLDLGCEIPCLLLYFTYRKRGEKTGNTIHNSKGVSMFSQRIGVGVCGLGNAGWGIHLRYLHSTPKFEVVGVYDIGKKRIKMACKEFSCRGYSTYEDMLKDTHIQLVVIATPNHLHKDLTVQALKNGKNVIVEKPMCVTTEEANSMIEVAKQSGLMLSAHQNRRWDGDFLAIKEVVGKGVIGKPIFIQSKFFGGPYRPMSEDLKMYGGDWKKSWSLKKEFGGGALHSWGVHLLDQILSWIKSPVSTVFGIVKSVIGFEDYFKSILDFKDGLRVEVEVSRCSRITTSMPRWYIIGEKGDISMFFKSDIVLRKNCEDKEKKLKKYPDKNEEYYENIYGVLTGDQELIVTPEQVRKVVMLSEAIRESSQTKQTVKLPGYVGI